MLPPHQSLLEQLERLETDKEENGEAITEVRRRIEVLDEVMSWSVTEEEPKKEFPWITKGEGILQAKLCAFTGVGNAGHPFGDSDSLLWVLLLCDGQVAGTRNTAPISAG